MIGPRLFSFFVSRYLFLILLASTAKMTSETTCFQPWAFLLTFLTSFAMLCLFAIKNTLSRGPLGGATLRASGHELVHIDSLLMACEQDLFTYMRVHFRPFPEHVEISPGGGVEPVAVEEREPFLPAPAPTRGRNYYKAAGAQQEGQKGKQVPGKQTGKEGAGKQTEGVGADVGRGGSSSSSSSSAEETHLCHETACATVWVWEDVHEMCSTEICTRCEIECEKDV